MLRFFPVPDPFFPHTMTRENVQNAQRMGILHNGFAMYIAANLQMFGEDSKDGALETLPADDVVLNSAGMQFGKYWADRFNVPESYVYFDRGENENSGERIRSVAIKATNTEAGGFDHPTFNIYNLRCAQFYREFADLMMAWGGVPALRLYKNVYGEATKRLSFANGEGGKPLPSVAIPLKLMPGDGTGLGELVFRFNPENGCVEYFSPQELFQAIREKKFDVKAEIERALRLRHNPPADKPADKPAETPAGSGSIVPANPVSVTAPPAAEAISHWEGLDINNSTGEAIVNGIQTGLYFERPAQVLPNTGGNPDVDRSLQMISPLSYATKYTADQVLAKLREYLKGWELTTVMGDPNKMFPVSVLARYVAVKLGDGSIVPASNIGLIAQTIARTTAEVSDGRGGKKIVQDWNGALETAVGEIRRAVDDYQAKLK